MILILFADDMVLFSETKSGLQQGLDKLHEYCCDWGLDVNVDKTKCLVFKNGGRSNVNDVWYYNGNIIETISYFKYLGFVFSSTGKFKNGIDNLEIRGTKAFFDMISSIQNYNDMQFQMKLDLFDSLVKSVICYGCEIWGFSEAKKLDTMYLRFLKQTLCVRKTVPTCFVYKECDVYPLYITRLFRIINYWLKIISLDEHSPLKTVYNIALELNENDNNFKPASFWIENVKKTLFKYGFGYVWLNQKYANDFSFMNYFKKTVIDSFWQENEGNINELSQNRLYRHLKAESIFYLRELPNNFIRIALNKLRFGSHFFMVERGRWKKT